LVLLCPTGHRGGIRGQEPASVGPMVERGKGQELVAILTRLMTAAERVSMGGRMGTAGDSLPDVADLCRAVRWLDADSAADRYVHIRDWMFPPDPAAPMRNAQCFAPAEFPPEWFFVAWADPGPAAVGPGDRQGQDGVISFLELLVRAAAETDQLDALARLSAARAGRCEVARSLLQLTSFALARSKGEAPDADALRAELHKAIVAPGNARSKLWPVYLTARALSADDTYRSVGVEVFDGLLAAADAVPLRPLQSHCVRDRATARVAQTGGHAEPTADPQLKLWQPGGYYFNGGSQAGTWPAWWVEHDGVILSVSGPEVKTLQFACPLTGSFEVTARVAGDSGADAAVQFGRVVFHSSTGLDRVAARSIGEQEMVPRKIEPGSAGTATQIRVVATPEIVRYYRDDVLMFEDASPSPTTPWLVLVSRSPRSCAWTDLKITGAPQVPREVPLIGDDRMEGWMSPLYRERLPRQFATKPLDSGTVALERPKDANGDWSVVQGELIGKAMGTVASKITSQSWLAYHRGLQPGDVLSYEFYYEPGKTIVWPSLGRVAFLVEPVGVRLHWITDIPHMAVGGLTPDNAVVDPRAARTARAIALRPNAWNSMSVTVRDRVAELSLNGSDIYEHPLAPTDSRLFGLFHYRSDSQARVRGLVLRGNWPTTLRAEDLSQLTRHSGPASSSPAELMGLKTLLDEPWIPQPAAN
jgi:hypothetical protein